MKKKLTLSELTELQTKLYLRDRSKIHLEAAIASLLHEYSIDETAKILRDSAAHLEEFG